MGFFYPRGDDQKSASWFCPVHRHEMLNSVLQYVGAVDVSAMP